MKKTKKMALGGGLSGLTSGVKKSPMTTQRERMSGPDDRPVRSMASLLPKRNRMSGPDDRPVRSVSPPATQSGAMNNTISGRPTPQGRSGLANQSGSGTVPTRPLPPSSGAATQFAAMNKSISGTPMKKGGSVSARADGCAVKGKTKGRMV